MITDLPIPQARDELSLHRVGSWEEEAIDTDLAWNASSQKSREPSLSSHAVAFGSFVFGSRQNFNEAEPWLTWKTSFAPYRVCRVVSNYDGSIIVCSTDAGTVALLRGIDGSVLATRKVAQEDDGILAAANISFIGRPISKNAPNAVIIGVPNADPAKPDFDFLMVSNIDPIALNDKNPLRVADAARNMSIDTAIDLNRGRVDVRSVCGCVLDEARIRLVTIDAQETIAVQDYVGPGAQLSVVCDSISWNTTNSLKSSLSIDIGLRYHELNDGLRFVLFCATDGSKATINCFDPVELVMAGVFDIPSDNKKPRERVLAIEPLASALPESAFALAVASGSKDATTIHVLQAELKGRLLGNPHVVYTIPVSSTMKSISMAALHSPQAGPYAFRYKIWQGAENNICKVFATANGGANGGTIGRIRFCIRSEHFDGADQLISACGENTLMKDPYADFHPSEVAVGRLRQILREGNVCDKTTLTQAKQCLHRLASGCISGNEKAGWNLLEVAECIAQWANPGSSQIPRSLKEIMTALSAVAKTIAEVLKILPTEQHPVFEEKKQALEDQLCVLKYLSSILPEDPEEVISLTSRFQGSRSPGELFASLVAEQCFEMAEAMWKSYLRPQILPEVAVESILRIRRDTDPRTYICLVEESVLPCLTINHELLPSLLFWACQVADELDDKSSIDDAIFLLEAMERGTIELKIRLHSSFSSFSPFVENLGTRRTKILGQNKDSSNSDISFASSSSPSKRINTAKSGTNAQENSIPAPTVLEMGRIKGGAIKSRPVSHGMQNLKRVTGEDTEEDSEVRIRKKLLHARCLKAARELGLEKKVASLRTFSDFDSMQSFTKELVRSLSLSAQDHCERARIFSEELQVFCNHFDVDFDCALLDYSKELCSSTVASEKTIQEAASVAQCCKNASKKCQCILIVLRAALCCGYSPGWLKELSQEAVEWAALDLSLRSELIEAARLLLVDGIVRSYVGGQGCALFRVENPRHAIRLLEFVTQHYQRGSVLDDALDLADAFNHLSRLDACTNICYQAIQGGFVEICTDICEKLYERESHLADSTCARVVAYCSDLVAECAHGAEMGLPSSRMKMLQNYAVHGSRAASSVISIAFAHSQSVSTDSSLMNPYSKIDFKLLEANKKDFLVIQYLQVEFSVFGLSISSIRSGPKKLIKVGASLLDPVVKSYVAGESSWSVQLTKARRACSLLAEACYCSEKEFWCAVVATVASPMKWSHDDGRCLGLLGDLGVLGGYRASTAVSARTILSTAFSLCMKASKCARSDQDSFFNNFGRALSLLQDFCLVSCPRDLLVGAQSLSTLAETTWHVVIRGDEGVGERLERFRKSLLENSWSFRDPFILGESTCDKTKPDLPALCQPNLHPSWYIGDGLLLPPSESICRTIEFSKEMMGCMTVTAHKFGPECISEIAKFLSSRGALSVALRLLTNSSVVLLCSHAPESTYGSLGTVIQEVIAEGASRYVGGSGNGIISKVVDSEHAVCFLLSLPIKLAFKVYRSALPTAMKTRDYPRVLALANIGLVAGAGRPGGPPEEILHKAWRRQEKFVVQCKQLGQKAFWWRFLKKHEIEFDHRCFENNDKKTDDESGGEVPNTAYALSLVTPIIVRLLSIKEINGDILILQDALNITTKYAETFGLQREKVVECFVQFILSAPSYTGCDDGVKDDIRSHIPKVERTMQVLLPLLQPIMRRATALRRCVLNLERDEARDYDRHSLVLSLYRKTLYEITEMEPVLQRIDPAIFEAELEAIDRRCDALAILSSVFEGERKGNRPSFSGFFSPLPTDISSISKYASPTAACGILGNVEGEGRFDPLTPLQDVLLRCYDANTSMALAPLCLPLGLPNGYIHARFLMEHFRLAAGQSSTLPSFEHDMTPVFSRIQSAGDKAALAEWCSEYYNEVDEERLKCLDLALNCAIKYSSEVEHRKDRFLNSKCDDPETQATIEREETKALESVQRLSRAKSSLSDKITVLRALLSTEEQIDPAVSAVTKELMVRLNGALWQPQKKHAFPPEKVVEVLLSEASLLAAKLCLETVPFSFKQFRQLSSLCNEACNALADDHSHIHTGHIASTMVRSWLFQGDDITGEQKQEQEAQRSFVPSISMKSSKASNFDDLKEEDTINFVMDLNNIQDPLDEDRFYSNEIDRGSSKKNVTSDEEPSALKKSIRESTEDMAKRVALRVAFVMASDDPASHHRKTRTDEERSDENSSSVANSSLNLRSSAKSKSGGLLARIEKGDSKQNTYVLDCARELLRIVFAKSEIQDHSSNLAQPEQNLCQTVTFSMRHRALRAAAILVPQEALEMVIREERYLVASGAESHCSLKRCTFGAFVAKECEQIGLPLSHSDLGHISSMHFSSYARTLWRHFRDGDLKGSKGRLLLLLLEMTLQGEGDTDAAFIEMVLKEIGRLHLPRTLLLACECIMSLKEVVGSTKYSCLLSTSRDTVKTAIVTSAKAIFSELHGLVRSESLEDTNASETIATLRRLAKVVQAFSEEQFTQFIGALLDVAARLTPGSLRTQFSELIRNALGRVSNQEELSKLRNQFLSIS